MSTHGELLTFSDSFKRLSVCSYIYDMRHVVTYILSIIQCQGFRPHKKSLPNNIIFFRNYELLFFS